MLTDLPIEDIERLEFFVNKYDMSTREFIDKYEGRLVDRTHEFNEWYALVIKGIRKI